MTKLSYLHEPGVMHNLAQRYTLDEIYVSRRAQADCGRAAMISYREFMLQTLELMVFHVTALSKHLGRDLAGVKP